MADRLSDMMQREWHLTNSDANTAHSTHLAHPHALSRKASDQVSQQYHSHQHPSLPTITTTDYSDPSSLPVLHVSERLFGQRHSSDVGYDTDGGIEAVRPTSQRHYTISHSHEHLTSPKLPSRGSSGHASKQLPVIPSQRRPSHDNHLAVSQSSALIQHHDEKTNESSERANTRRRHIRLSRRLSRPTPTQQNQEGHASAIPRHDAVLAADLTRRPLRLVFMRHSERANQVLGPYWFIKAFQSGVYHVYDPLLPTALPKRRSDLAYEFDVPLTVNGLKNARHTGRAMLNSDLMPDICLSSTALRCIQTCERVLTGMNCAARIPIRVELGLFECPHVQQKIVDSFMTKAELVENGYNIKLEYKPLVHQINVPESLDQYFDRAVTVMRGIVDRYGHRGGTILIVTHAPGLLALTDAIKGVRPDQQTFYRTVATYPPLAMYIAQYDGVRWKHSEQPFAITPFEK